MIVKVFISELELTFFILNRLFLSSPPLLPSPTLSGTLTVAPFSLLREEGIHLSYFEHDCNASSLLADIYRFYLYIHVLMQHKEKEPNVTNRARTSISAIGIEWMSKWSKASTYQQKPQNRLLAEIGYAW